MAGKSYSVKAIISGVDHLTAPMRRIAGNIKSTLVPALRGIRSVASFAGRAIRGMLSPLGLLAGGGFIAGLGGLLKSFVETGDSIGEFAAQVGIGTTALQEYEYAAERAGVESGTFRRSLEFFGKTIGKARTEGGKFAGVLGKMPRSFRQALAGARSTDEALQIAIGSLGAVRDESERAALAQALFGKSGAKMALLAAQGADGIKALREEAQRLGVVLSEDAVKAAGDADDKLIQFKGAVRGLKTAIASELLPVFVPLLKDLTEWFAKNREIIGQRIGDFIRGIVDWLRKVDFGAILRGIGDFFGVVKDVFNALGGVKGLLVGIAAMTFAPLVASLGPVGVALAAVLALVVGIRNNLDALNNRGKAKQGIASGYVASAARTGDAGALRRGRDLAAAGLSDTRRAGAVKSPFGDSLGGRLAGGLLTPFSLLAARTTGGPAPIDMVRASHRSAEELVAALKSDMAQTGPHLAPSAALSLDLTVRRDGTVDATVTDSTGPVDTRIQTPRGARMHGR